MATATLSPSPGLQFIDANGDPGVGWKIYTYNAGTTSDAFTYSSPTISVGTRNSNPVVCDAAGRCVIYLVPGSSYKYVVKTNLDVLVFTVDNIAAVGNAATAANQHGVAQGRLTLTTGVPVTTADVTAATAVLYTPYTGNQISLFDGVSWALYQFSELSLAIAGFAINTNFDVFATPSSATAALSAVAWTNATTRATLLTLQDGALVKTGDTTALYLGTFRTTGTLGQTEDSAAKRFVWNYYNRAARKLQLFEVTGSWNYTTLTWRQARATATNQLDFVIGVSEDAVQAILQGNYANTNTGVLAGVSIGLDSTTTPSTDAVYGLTASAIANAQFALTASYQGYPGVGRHVLVWLEESVAAGTGTFYGSTNAQSGLLGWIRG